ncbi:LRR receptor-like serine/threonine-protein kinase FLS2-like [Trifolium medium]|uniref:LRR receptor-like serine/threonine-protein kinase FLS2-like n=1 Tax=Trifolium medium TaxID=97028 RepID=A0A392M1H2_9FABA|nr:LRR receptor-like serine/threonine-protein kinase FLS2-like [Trifolium medium]
MLNYLDISRASFSGVVPTHLGNLSNLQYLDISTQFSPLSVSDLSWLSSLSSLQYLNMNFINITNTPHELFRVLNKLPSLLELHLASCSLASLPPSSPLLNITSLSVLDLSANPFNSSIPSWLFNMSTLTNLNLYHSSIIGLVPSTLGRWKLCKLQVLQLSTNFLIGDIAEMIEAMSCSNRSLKFLYLSQNQLTGKLPNSLGKFNHLFGLDLSDSGISGPIPTSIGNLSNLGSLNLEGNMMNGTIPESIGQLTNLYSLNLLENYWEGEIPEFWMGMKSLYTIDLSNNRLAGGIPTSICSLPLLFILELRLCTIHDAYRIGPERKNS